MPSYFSCYLWCFYAIMMWNIYNQRNMKKYSITKTKIDVKKSELQLLKIIFSKIRKIKENKAIKAEDSILSILEDKLLNI